MSEGEDEVPELGERSFTPSDLPNEFVVMEKGLSLSRIQYVEVGGERVMSYANRLVPPVPWTNFLTGKVEGQPKPVKFARMRKTILSVPEDFTFERWNAETKCANLDLPHYRMNEMMVKSWWTRLSGKLYYNLYKTTPLPAADYEEEHIGVVCMRGATSWLARHNLEKNNEDVTTFEITVTKPDQDEVVLAKIESKVYEDGHSGKWQTTVLEAGAGIVEPYILPFMMIIYKQARCSPAENFDAGKSENDIRYYTKPPKAEASS